MRENYYPERQEYIVIVNGAFHGWTIFYDLLKESEQFGYQLDWVTRTLRFFQMETAKLTLEILCSDYGTY